MPWLDALEEAGARLAGVYSVPLLAPVLAARLGLRGTRALVVTANRAGLRQCFVDGGKLRFARLERIVEMVPAQALAAFVRSETLRLTQYLTTLRALPRDGGPLQAVVIAPPGERALFEQVLVSDARVAFHTMDGADARRVVGLRAAPEDTGAEAIYLQLAARKPPREQFASSARAAQLLHLAAAARHRGSGRRRVRRLRPLQRQPLGRGGERARARRTADARSARGDAAVRAHHRHLPGDADHHREPARDRGGVPAHRGAQRLRRTPRSRMPRGCWTASRRWRSTRSTGTCSSPASSAAPNLPRLRRPLTANRPRKASATLQFAISGRVNATQRNDYRGITAQVQRFAEALASGGL